MRNIRVQKTKIKWETKKSKKQKLKILLKAHLRVVAPTSCFLLISLIGRHLCFFDCVISITKKGIISWLTEMTQKTVYIYILKKKTHFVYNLWNTKKHQSNEMK